MATSKKELSEQKSIKKDFKESYNGKTYRNLYEEYNMFDHTCCSCTISYKEYHT